MTNPEIEHFRHSVGLARESLGVALGQTQEIGDIGLDVASITRSLAAAIKCLFTAEAQGLVDSRLIGEAMDHMRDILGGMQDVTVRNDELEAATSSVARVLAVLFPVYKALPEAGVCKIVRESRLPPSPSAYASSAPLPALPCDKRGAQRISLEADIGVHSDTNFFTGFSLDISSGGLFVATYDTPPIGSLVNLNFRIPGGPVMSLDGRVRWMRIYNELTPDVTPGIGVCFDHLTESEERVVNDFIARTSPLFYDDL